MKFHNEYLTFHTKKHRAYVHITPQIETIRQKSGVKEGLVLVSAMHITAGVYANSSSSPPWRIFFGFRATLSRSGWIQSSRFIANASNCHSSEILQRRQMHLSADSWRMRGGCGH